MTRRFIQIGERFESLVVLSYAGSRGGKSIWNCKCDCGEESVVMSHNLTSGRTTSCGCYKQICLVTHGATTGSVNTGAYRTWKAMVQRCYDINAENFNHYGGRGIAICERWQEFAPFLDDMGERPEGKTIDRIDVNGNYEPSNCRWATKSEQELNKRRYG